MSLLFHPRLSVIYVLAVLLFIAAGCGPEQDADEGQEPTFGVEEPDDDELCQFDGERWDCAIDCTDSEEWPEQWKVQARRLVEESNEARSSPVDCDGMQPPAFALEHDEYLTEAARCHALDMAENQFFSHDGSDGHDEVERADEAGYESDYVGENLAMGQSTPNDAVEAWLESPGHCENIMHRAYRDTGTAYIEVGGTSYWIQKYGRVW